MQPLHPHLTVIKKMFLCVFLCAGIFLTCASPENAFAASSGPSVAIAKDMTSPTCVQTRVATKGKQKRTFTQKCRPGTMVGFDYVPLSKALAMHEPYVLKPTGKVSVSEQLQVNNKVVQLAAQKRKALGFTLKPKIVNPSTTCGWYSSQWASDFHANSTVYYTVNYYVSSNCSNISIDSVNIQGVQVSNALYWYQWLYANDSDRFGPPDCYQIYNSSSTRSINRNEPAGYGFVFNMSEYACISNVLYSVWVGPLD